MISVRVNQMDLNRIFAAIDRVGQVVESQKEIIPEESSREFSDLLKSNIVSQKYGSFGKPRRSDWKKGYPTSDQFWNWLGTVLKSITYWKIDGTKVRTAWWTGFKYTGPSTSKSSGGRVETAAGGAVPKKIVGKTYKTGAVIIKNGQRIEVRARLTPAQERQRAILREMAMARKAASTGVRHISTEGYVLQQRSAGTVLKNPILTSKQEKVISLKKRKRK